MRLAITHDDADRWRLLARTAVRRAVEPEAVCWADDAEASGLLPGIAGTLEADTSAEPLRLPRAFTALVGSVAPHRDPGRWDALYRVLFRIAVLGERRLLEDGADPDVRRVENLKRQVRFDAHKMKAFVRFKKAHDPLPGGGPGKDHLPGGGPGEISSERFLAWHRPAHRVLPMVAPFFARRFGVLRWTIMTPFDSADWDGQRLTLGPGAPASAAPACDEVEDLWRTYYQSIFNPARVKVGAMLKEMPRRYWETLPEASVIGQLLGDAEARVQDMLFSTDDHRPSAADFMPEPGPDGAFSLPVLRDAAKDCRGCELCDKGTQTVFGEGPGTARLALVGEQPGDREDTQGRPFVGPSGALLDNALAEAGVDRGEVYVTNAVKHFNWVPGGVPRGKVRLHQQPAARHIRACQPWLEAELGTVKPGVVVALGATAAQAMLGQGFRITRQRGEVIENTRWAPSVVATWHPAAILRADDGAKDTRTQELIADLKLALDLTSSRPSGRLIESRPSGRETGLV